MDIDADISRLRTLSRIATGFAALAMLMGVLQMALLVKESFFPEPPVIVVTAADARGAYDSQYDTPTSDPYYDPYYDDSYALPVEKTLGERMLDLAGQPEGIALIIMVMALIAFFVVIVMWVWRAHSNLTQRGIRLKNTPKRAVINYLIPLLNFVLPFEAMRELYNRSEGEPEEMADISVSDVTAWWTAIAVGLMIFVLLAIKYYINFSTPLIFYTPLWMEFIIVSFALFLLLSSALLLSALTRKITRFQADNLAYLAPDTPAESETVRLGVRLID